MPMKAFEQKQDYEIQSPTLLLNTKIETKDRFSKKEN
jgi:hypothetical protein